MAATYFSDLILTRNVIRPDSINEGVQTIRAEVKIPTGVDIGAGDIAKMIRLDYGVVPLRFVIGTDQLDAGAGLTVAMGIYQIAPGTTFAGTNASNIFTGQDVATGNVTPATGFPSPATNTTYFQATAGSIQTIMRAAGGGIDQIDITGADVVYATIPRTGFTGPVDISFTFPAGVAATTATTDRYITVYMDYVRKPDAIVEFTDRGGF